MAGQSKSSHRANHRVALAAGVALAAAWASPAAAESLDQELRALVAAHPQVLAAQKSVASAGEAVRQAYAGYLPTARIVGDSGWDHINSPARREYQGQAWDNGRDTSGLVVTEHLFDGYATTSAVGAAEMNRSVGEATLRATRQNTLLEGVTTYIDVLRQSALIQLGRDNEKNIQTQLNLEDERVKRGAGMAVDVLQAKQRLQVAKERRVAYDGALQNALARYQQVFGHAPDVVTLSDPQPAVDLLPPSLDEALDVAARENPSIDSSNRTIDVNSRKKDLAEAGYFPSIDLVAKADYEQNKESVYGIRHDWSVLVQLNWELFSGFKTRAAVAQATYDHAAAIDSKTYVGRKIAEQTRISWQTLATARERLGLLDNAVSLANELFDAQKKRREAGKATVFDVLDAESATYNARINYITASYDLRLSIYQVLHAMGRIDMDTIDRRHGGGAKAG